MSEEEEFTTRYEVLELPEFRSAIPAHLIVQLSDSERHIVETLSKLEQQGAWIAINLVKSSKEKSELDMRLQRIESWKEKFSVKWMMISGAGLTIFGALISALAAKWIHP